MTPTIDAYVHRTSNGTSSTRQTQAKEALERMDDQLDCNFNVIDGHQSLDASEGPDEGNNSRESWIKYCEDEFWSRDYIGTGDNVHVILSPIDYNAGFSVFNVGGEEFDGPWFGWDEKSYRSYGGQYGFANVSTKFDFTDVWFKNTVIHEVGHTFGRIHGDGMIRANSSGAYFASPMCTWYVEQKCITTINDKPGTLCHDDSGTKDACNHYQTMSSCTWGGINQWVKNKNI